MAVYFGKYRALVLKLDDPEKRGRIKVQCPEMYGDYESPWCEPCFSNAVDGAGDFNLPPVGEGVWIEFEKGDPQYPIYLGGWWSKSSTPVTDYSAAKTTRIIGKNGGKISFTKDGLSDIVNIEADFFYYNGSAIPDVQQILGAGAGLVAIGSLINVASVSSERIVVNEDSIDLAQVGTAGTYSRVTTDAYGRVVSGIASALTYADFPTQAQDTFLGRKSVGAGAPEVLSAFDARTILNVENGANNYSHPTSAGWKHLPANGTENLGKVLKAGSSEGNYSWEFVAFSDLTGIPTTLAEYGITDFTVNTANIADLAVTTAKIALASIGDAQIDRATVNKLVVTTADIGDAQITNAKIADATIEGAKIALASIDTAQIKVGAITTALIDTAAVGTTQIADGSITDAKIVGLTANKITAGTIDASVITVTNLNAENLTVGTINGTQISDGAISELKLDDGAVGSTKLADDAVTTDKIAAGAVLADNIVAGAITTDKLAAQAVIANKIAANVIEAGHIVSGTITTTQIAALTIVAGNIAASTITGDKLVADTITAREIAANTITASEIEAGTITATQIAANTIVAGNIAVGTITANEIAADAIGADQIAANAVTADKIVAGAITTEKIAAGAITATEIAAGTITATEIAGLTITGAKIAAGTIAGEKLIADTITAREIAASTITATEIAAGTITATQIATDAITADKIVANAVTTEKIAAGAITATEIAIGTITSASGIIAEIDASVIDVTNLNASDIKTGVLTVGGTGHAGSISVLNSLNEEIAKIDKYGINVDGMVGATGFTGDLAESDWRVSAYFSNYDFKVEFERDSITRSLLQLNYQSAMPPNGTVSVGIGGENGVDFLQALYFQRNPTTGSLYRIVSRKDIEPQDGYTLNFGSPTAEWANGYFTNLYADGNKVWHAGNDGSGSGLDADLLDGFHSSSFIKNENITAYTVQGNTAYCAWYHTPTPGEIYIINITANPNSPGSYLYRTSLSYLFSMGVAYNGTTICGYTRLTPIAVHNGAGTPALSAEMYFSDFANYSQTIRPISSGFQYYRIDIVGFNSSSTLAQRDVKVSLIKLL